MQLIPINDRLIIKPLEREDVTKGGIVLPDTAKEKPEKGEVIAIGPGRSLESGARQPLSVAVGDTVLFGKYSGSEFQHEEVKYLVLDEGDVLAVLRDVKTEEQLRSEENVELISARP